MTHVADDSGFPALFAHLNRADWGISVLSGQHDGKRRYLFESGEERTMGAGALDLMRKIEQPSSAQRATYAKLVALLAKRERKTEPPKAPGATAVVKQLERFHKRYSNGFFGKEWKSDKTSMHARQARGALVEKAQEQFAKETLVQLERTERFEAVWNLVVASLNESGLVSTELRPASLAEQQRALSNAVVELLYGSGGYEQRFDHWLPTHHHVADDDDVRGRIELRGLEALGHLDAEGLELRAHWGINVAVRASDVMARRLGDSRDAAHESAANAEYVEVHDVSTSGFEDYGLD